MCFYLSFTISHEQKNNSVHAITDNVVDEGSDEKSLTIYAVREFESTPGKSNACENVAEDLALDVKIEEDRGMNSMIMFPRDSDKWLSLKLDALDLL